jgi:hypothetical protein
MNDHHFSYPVVIPLQGVTISGHSSHPPAPAVSLQTVRPIQPVRPHQPVVWRAVDAAPAPGPAGPALAW